MKTLSDFDASHPSDLKDKEAKEKYGASAMSKNDEQTKDNKAQKPSPAKQNKD